MDRREVAVKKSNVVAVERKFFKLRLPVMDDRSQRLLRLIISKIDDRNDKTIPWLVFELTEVFELLGIPNDDHRWTKVRNALTELRKAEVVIPPEFFKPGTWDEALQDYLVEDEEITEHTGFIRSYRTYPKRGQFAVLLERTMIPFLLDVKQFQKYQVGEILNFRRDYTIRFYEWLISAKTPKTTTSSGVWYYNISIKELRRRLDLDYTNGRPKKYSQWRDLKQWVVMPSCEEISRHSPFFVHVEEIRRRGSRAVSSLIFHCEPKEKPKKAKQTKKPQAEIPVRDAKKARYDKLWNLYRKHSGDEDLVAKFQSVEGETINQFLGQYSEETVKQIAREAGLDAIEDDLIKKEGGR